MLSRVAAQHILKNAAYWKWNLSKPYGKVILRLDVGDWVGIEWTQDVFKGELSWKYTGGSSRSRSPYPPYQELTGEGGSLSTFPTQADWMRAVSKAFGPLSRIARKPGDHMEPAMPDRPPDEETLDALTKPPPRKILNQLGWDSEQVLAIVEKYLKKMPHLRRDPQAFKNWLVDPSSDPSTPWRSSWGNPWEILQALGVKDVRQLQALM